MRSLFTWSTYASAAAFSGLMPLSIPAMKASFAEVVWICITDADQDMRLAATVSRDGFTQSACNRRHLARYAKHQRQQLNVHSAAA